MEIENLVTIYKFTIRYLHLALLRAYAAELSPSRLPCDVPKLSDHQIFRLLDCLFPTQLVARQEDRRSKHLHFN